MYVYFYDIVILGICYFNANIWANMKASIQWFERGHWKKKPYPVHVRMRMKSGRSFPVGQEEEKGGHRNPKR